mmetsp:Transcript_11843/g.26462  ORF Transcript_11843/g.26462 Transcript_11843/m.26462 type:complete len:113 (-) Transcript_11843:192-530(-)
MSTLQRRNRLFVVPKRVIGGRLRTVTMRRKRKIGRRLSFWGRRLYRVETTFLDEGINTDIETDIIHDKTAGRNEECLLPKTALDKRFAFWRTYTELEELLWLSSPAIPSQQQ